MIALTPDTLTHCHTVLTSGLRLCFAIMGHHETLEIHLTAYKRSASYYQGQSLGSERGTGCVFNASGTPRFMSLYESVTTSHSKQMVMMCAASHSLCGGIADRAMGIPFAVILALLGKRQLILDDSLLMNGPAPSNLTRENHYVFIDGACQNLDLIQRFWNDDSSTIYVTSNCVTSMPVLTPNVNDTIQDTLEDVQRECKVLYLCGAAALHHTEIFREMLDAARSIADTLWPWLPPNNYTALHIRAGGSLVDVGGLVKAVAWDDGYASEIPQWWIDGFRKSSYQGCKNNVALLSDSARVLSELRHAAQDRLMIPHCCVQALHRDRFAGKSFSLQEIVDLFVMARSRRIVGGMGGFSTLGKYWLGGEGPELVLGRSLLEVEHAMHLILFDAQCTDIDVII